VYFAVPSYYTVDDDGWKSVTVKTSDKKIPVTVMLAALADGRKLSPFMILNHTTVPKEKIACRNHCQMLN